MGSLPTLSILKGPSRPLIGNEDPIALHRIFETTVSMVEKINAANNNQIKAVHSIDINESEAQQTALITTKGETTTFSKLNEIANKLGRAILRQLTKSSRKHNEDGDFLVAVCIEPSEALVATLLAIWKIGAAYLPLDKTFPLSRIKHILTESRPIMVIVDNFVMGDDTEVVKYDTLKEASNEMSGTNISQKDTLTKDVPASELLAIVLYTSGSTGAPKGVRLTHRAILNRLKWQWRKFPYSPSEKVCIFKTALTFVDSVSELWGPLLYARSILIVLKEDTSNPEKLTAILEKYSVERIILVPTLLTSILLYAGMKKAKNFLPKLRLWICSGEPLPVSLARDFFDKFDQKNHFLCNFYGSTEIMGDVTYHIIEGREELEGEEKVPIGKPLDNCVVYIMNKDHRPVNLNEIGELYISGLNLASGYVKGRDAEKFCTNYLTVDPGHQKLYKTGDYARMFKNVLYYEGREDNQIKVRGHRVDLSEIESALAKIKEIDMFVVLVYRSGEIQQNIVAFVTVKEDISEKAIENQLAELLVSYMIPQVIKVEHFPLLVNGKVDRQYFLQKYKEEYSQDRKQKSSTIDYTGVEKEKMERARALFETTCSVLGRSLRGSINASANFYSLGGNSLNSIYTITKLRDMGFAISVTDFISSPTLLDVINKMQEVKDKEETSSTTESVADKYKTRKITEAHKNEVFSIITSSFYEKADLEKYLLPPILMTDYVELMEVLWPHIIEKNLSFVAMDLKNNIKGVALNFDANDEPEINLRKENKLNIIFEFLEFLEGPFRREKLPTGKNKIFHNFMMGTKPDLHPQETIEIFLFMEDQVLKLASERNFVGVLTANTNPLTQQLGSDINHYETLLNYQVNKFVASDGSKPFKRAPNTQRTIISWKTLKNKSTSS